MKPFLKPVFLLAAILTASILNCWMMQRETTRWQAQVQTVEAAAAEGNWGKADAALAGSYADWSARQTYLHIVAEHAAVDGADVLFRRCAAFLAEKDLSEFQAEAIGLCHQLQLLYEMEQFSIKNIL